MTTSRNDVSPFGYARFFIDPTGFQVTITDFNYTEGTADEPVYSNQLIPRAIAQGVYSGTGSITMGPTEFRALNAASLAAGGFLKKFLTVMNVTIFSQAAVVPPGNYGLLIKFHEQAFSTSQGDSEATHVLTFNMYEPSRIDGVPTMLAGPLNSQAP